MKNLTLLALSIILSINSNAQGGMADYTGVYECIQKKVWTNNNDTTHYFSWDTVTVYVSEHESNPIRLVFVDSTFLNDSTIYYPYDYYEVTVADTLTNQIFPWMLHGGWGWFYPEYDSLQMYITAGTGQWGSKSWYYWGNSIITSVQDHIQPELKIYPNPAKNQLNIELHTLERIAKYHIYNLHGQLLSSSEFSGSTSLDVSYFLKGIYVIQVLSEGKLYSNKIIIN